MAIQTEWVTTNIYRLFQISVTHHRIPFHFFSVFVNGEGFPATGEEDTAIETSGLFSCYLCPAKGFFMGGTIIRPHCSSFSAKIKRACAKVWEIQENELWQNPGFIVFRIPV